MIETTWSFDSIDSCHPACEVASLIHRQTQQVAHIGAPAALAASPLRSDAANAAEEVPVLLVLIKVRFLSPPNSNCPGSTCLTHLGTEGSDRQPTAALLYCASS